MINVLWRDLCRFVRWGDGGLLREARVRRRHVVAAGNDPLVNPNFGATVREPPRLSRRKPLPFGMERACAHHLQLRQCLLPYSPRQRVCRRFQRAQSRCILRHAVAAAKCRLQERAFHPAASSSVCVCACVRTGSTKHHAYAPSISTRQQQQQEEERRSRRSRRKCSKCSAMRGKEGQHPPNLASVALAP